jgi:hypothetical protein
MNVEFFRFQQLKVGTFISLPTEHKLHHTNSIVCFDAIALLVVITDNGLAFAYARKLMHDMTTANKKGNIKSTWNTISLQKSFKSIKRSCCQTYLLASCNNCIYIFNIKDLIQVLLLFLS